MNDVALKQLSRLWIVCVVLGVLGLASCSQGGSTSSTTTTTPTTPTAVTVYPFIVHDNTLYSSTSTLLTAAGTLRTTVVYGQSTWPGTCTSSGCPNAPTQSEFQTVLENYVSTFGSSSYIVFDFESLVLSEESSTAAAKNAVALMQQMIGWTRALYPNAKIGAYDYDYTASYSPSSTAGYNTIRQALYKGDSNSFDFFAPSLYQRWSTHTIWDQNLAQSIINDSYINQTNGVSLPIYTYISPYVSGAYTSGLLDSSEWSSELDDLVSCSNPASSACTSVMSAVTPSASFCSYSTSTTPCTALEGAVLWASSSAPAPTSTTDWIVSLYTAMSPALQSTSKYTVASVGQSGLCVDAGSYNGTMALKTCTQSNAQQWFWIPLSSGTFAVESYGYQVANPSLGINDIWNGSTGTPMMTLLASGGTASASTQQWMPVSLNNGYYELVMRGDYSTVGNTNTNLCLTVASSSSLTLTACNESSDQIFKLSAL